MITVFISGSRKISQLNADVKKRLDRIVENRLQIVIGDANGVDKAVQQYLHSQAYNAVEVFFSGSYCRNNLGGWLARTIFSDRKTKDYLFYTAKDMAMADEATHGLAIWDGESFGTLMNVARLVQQHKPVALYLAPERCFAEFRDEEEWREFVKGCSVTLRRRIEKESAIASQPAQRKSEQVGIQTFLS